MLWLAAVMSVLGGGVGGAPLDRPMAGQPAPDATRSGAIPTQRSTAQSTSLRFALLSEHALEAATASGFDGHAPALAPAIALDLPVWLVAHGEKIAAAIATPASTTGFRARAPPILA
jgi:hypothetical protein